MNALIPVPDGEISAYEPNPASVAAAHASSSPVSGSRQVSKSIPVYGSSALKT